MIYHKENRTDFRVISSYNFTKLRHFNTGTYSQDSPTSKIQDIVEVLCWKPFTLSRPIWDIDIDKTEIW